MKTAIKTYHRPDGVVGCGFYGEFGGLWQHSIAWPDQTATRMRFEDLEERQIAIKDLAVVPVGKRDLIDMADQPGEGYAAGCVDYVKANANKNGDSMVVEDVYVGPPVLADQEIEDFITRAITEDLTADDYRDFAKRSNLPPSYIYFRITEAEKAIADQKAHPLEAWIDEESHFTDQPVDDIPGSVDSETGEVTKAEQAIMELVDAATEPDAVDPPAPEDASPFDASTSEAANIRTALALFPDATNKEIIEMLNREKIEIASSQVTRERKAIAKAAEENESSE